MNYVNYFTEIEETFIRRRGKHLLLSPLDWALIESWQERKIPLRIVLSGIENVFDSVDKNPNHIRSIKSLSYCREEVEAQYTEWMGTQVGKSVEKDIKSESEKKENKNNNEIKHLENESTLFSDEVIHNHLENLTKLLFKSKAKSNESLRQIIDKVTKKLSEHKENKTEAVSLEESLNDLEILIDKALLESSDEKLLEKLSKQTENELIDHKKTMEKEVYQRTFDLMILKKLREHLEIPRLSLFYL